MSAEQDAATRLKAVDVRFPGRQCLDSSLFACNGRNCGAFRQVCAVYTSAALRCARLPANIVQSGECSIAKTWRPRYLDLWRQSAFTSKSSPPARGPR